MYTQQHWQLLKLFFYYAHCSRADHAIPEADHEGHIKACSDALIVEGKSGLYVVKFQSSLPISCLSSLGRLIV